MVGALNVYYANTFLISNKVFLQLTNRLAYVTSYFWLEPQVSVNIQPLLSMSWPRDLIVAECYPCRLRISRRQHRPLPGCAGLSETGSRDDSRISDPPHRLSLGHPTTW